MLSTEDSSAVYAVYGIEDSNAVSGNIVCYPLKTAVLKLIVLNAIYWSKHCYLLKIAVLSTEDSSINTIAVLCAVYMKIAYWF